MPEVVIIVNVSEHTYAQFNMPQLLFKTQKQIIINPPKANIWGLYIFLMMRKNYNHNYVGQY